MEEPPVQPKDPAPGLPEEAPGYLSADDKQRYTVRVGVVGALFLVGQFILPMAVAMPLMFAGMFFTMSDVRIPQAGAGAVFEGAVWYPERTMGMGPGAGRGTGAVRLVRFPLDAEGKPEDVAVLDSADARLLPAPDGLWVISPTGTGILKGDTVEMLPGTEDLGGIARPFLLDGRPAVVRQDPDGIALLALRDGSWTRLRALALGSEDQPVDVSNDVQVLAEGETLHVFLSFGGSLYYRRQPVEESGDPAGTWETVGSTGRHWSAMLLDGAPAVVLAVGRSNGPAQMVDGVKRVGGRWDPFFSRKVPSPTTMGAYALEERGAFALLVQGMPGSVRLLRVDDGTVSWQARQKGSFPFGGSFMALMMAPQLFTFLLPLILAAIFSWLMRRHRACEFVSGDRAVPFASLPRRGAAQIVDGLILGTPVAAGSFLFLFTLFDMEEMLLAGPGFFVAGAGIMALGMLWGLAGLALFSVLEGRSGATPGKWLLGIRVLGLDLEPVGFLRALVRNLLRFVDGMFSYMIGIFLIALTENWQRLGDLAARSIVVDIRGGKDGEGG